MLNIRYRYCVVAVEYQLSQSGIVRSAPIGHVFEFKVCLRQTDIQLRKMFIKIASILAYGANEVECQIVATEPELAITCVWVNLLKIWCKRHWLGKIP